MCRLPVSIPVSGRFFGEALLFPANFSAVFSKCFVCCRQDFEIFISLVFSQIYEKCCEQSERKKIWDMVWGWGVYVCFGNFSKIRRKSAVGVFWKKMTRNLGWGRGLTCYENPCREKAESWWVSCASELLKQSVGCPPETVYFVLRVILRDTQIVRLTEHQQKETHWIAVERVRVSSLIHSTKAIFYLENDTLSRILSEPVESTQLTRWM